MSFLHPRFCDSLIFSVQSLVKKTLATPVENSWNIPLSSYQLRTDFKIPTNRIFPQFVPFTGILDFVSFNGCHHPFLDLGFCSPLKVSPLDTSCERVKLRENSWCVCHTVHILYFLCFISKYPLYFSPSLFYFPSFLSCSSHLCICDFVSCEMITTLYLVYLGFCIVFTITLHFHKLWAIWTNCIPHSNVKLSSLMPLPHFFF